MGDEFYTDDETTRRQSNRAAVLEALQTAGAAGLTNAQLTEIGGMRYGGRIHELRAAGHHIVAKHEGEGLWRFTLREGPPAVRYDAVPVVVIPTPPGRLF